MKLLIAHNAVAADAAPDCADVLTQVHAIAEAAAAAGHEAATLAWPDDPAAARRALAQAVPDAVINLVEEVGGVEADACVAAALLEEAGVPFTGCGASALQLTANKLTAKAVLAAQQLPVPRWRSADGRGNAATPGTFLLKPEATHGSAGLDEEHLYTAADDVTLCARLAAYAEPRFAEEFMPGREFAIALLEQEMLPAPLAPAEIVFTGAARIVGYAAKWLPESYAGAHTLRRLDFPPEDGPLLSEVVALARQCWRILGLAGYARIDLRCGDDGRPRVLDVNANPCLASDAGFLASAAASGLSLAQVFECLLAAACRRSGVHHV